LQNRTFLCQPTPGLALHCDCQCSGDSAHHYDSCNQTTDQIWFVYNLHYSIQTTTLVTSEFSGISKIRHFSQRSDSSQIYPLCPTHQLLPSPNSIPTPALEAKIDALTAQMLQLVSVLTASQPRQVEMQQQATEDRDDEMEEMVE
jgi:hypothetical protein